jgi:RNase P subunit RPR2
MNWIKKLFCKHDDDHSFLTKDAKIGDRIIKNSIQIGSKRICKKCGRVDYYYYGI